MHIPRELLIDIGLNVAMSMTAGGAWVLVYSMFRRPTRAKATRTGPERISQPESTSPTSRRELRPIEFVNLRQSADTEIDAAGNAGAVSSDGYRRNRSEVIRLAREMLATGSTREGIRRNLPISEGELAMLANR